MVLAASSQANHAAVSSRIAPDALVGSSTHCSLIRGGFVATVVLHFAKMLPNIPTTTVRCGAEAAARHHDAFRVMRQPIQSGRGQ